MADYDPSDPEQIKAAQKAEDDAAKDIDYILKEPRGRRWLYQQIFGAAHVHRGSHVPASSDDTAFNEGARSVGLVLMESIRVRAPAKFMLMLEENHFDD